MNKFKQFQNLEKLFIDKKNKLNFFINDLAALPDECDELCKSYQEEMIKLTYEISLLAQWLKGDQK